MSRKFDKALSGLRDTFPSPDVTRREEFLNQLPQTEKRRRAALPFLLHTGRKPLWYALPAVVTAVLMITVGINVYRNVPPHSVPSVETTVTTITETSRHETVTETVTETVRSSETVRPSETTYFPTETVQGTASSGTVQTTVQTATLPVVLPTQSAAQTTHSPGLPTAPHSEKSTQQSRSTKPQESTSRGGAIRTTGRQTTTTEPPTLQPSESPEGSENTTQTTLRTTRPTTEPTTMPTTEPTTKPTTMPTTEPTTMPTTKPTTVPTTVPTTIPTTQTMTTDPTEPATDPTEPTMPVTTTTVAHTWQTTENPTEASSEPTTEGTVNPTDFATTEPTEEPTTNGGVGSPGPGGESTTTEPRPVPEDKEYKPAEISPVYAPRYEEAENAPVWTDYQKDFEPSTTAEFWWLEQPDKASNVVIGKIVRVRYTLYEGCPYTAIDVKIRESLRGSCHSGTLTVLEPGGYIPLDALCEQNAAVRQRVEAMTPEERAAAALVYEKATALPDPVIGETCLLFLDMQDDNTFLYTGSPHLSRLEFARRPGWYGTYDGNFSISIDTLRRYSGLYDDIL